MTRFNLAGWIAASALMWGCGGATTAQCPTPEPRQIPAATDMPKTAPAASSELPEGPDGLLRRDDAMRAKLYLGSERQVDKWVTYVDVAKVPDWLKSLADEKLGQGADVEYEIEYYGAELKVHEVTREIDGKRLELSVKESDRSVYYKAETAEMTALPKPAQLQVQELLAGKSDRLDIKTFGDGKTEFHVRGKLDAVEHRLVFDAAGKLIGHRRSLPAKIEVPVRSK